MLEEFRVDNFKSLINVVYEPQQVNLLIGKNNSGKTSLCQALRFVSHSTAWPLTQCADSVAGGQHGLTNFAFDKKEVDFYVRAKLRFHDEELTFEYRLMILPPEDLSDQAGVRVGSENLTVTGGKFNRTVLLQNTAGSISLLNEEEFINGTGNYVKTNTSLDSTMLRRLYDSEVNSRTNFFKSYLYSWVYYDLSPTAMKDSKHTPNDFTLHVNGSNIASSVYGLKTSNERDYRNLLKVMKVIEPNLDLINFPVIWEDQISMVFEDSEGHSLPISRSSNGTLRFLAIAYVLLFQPKGDLRPIVMIEEPENGIYVGFLKSLLEMTDRINGPQVIFTSHAPYFIDLFDDNLDAIFVISRDKHHSSIVQPDGDKVKGWLRNDFPLGEQHFRGMLG